MRGDDVPQQDFSFESQLTQHALDDGRGRFRRPRSGQLALRGERDPGEAGSAIARRLADEEDRRLPPRLEVRDEPPPEQRGPRAVGVLVERATDPRGGQLLDECRRRYDGASVTGSSGRPG
jgi:hypothetical protein